jgi:hypothetical protein
MDFQEFIRNFQQFLGISGIVITSRPVPISNLENRKDPSKFSFDDFILLLRMKDSQYCMACFFFNFFESLNEVSFYDIIYSTMKKNDT